MGIQSSTAYHNLHATSKFSWSENARSTKAKDIRILNEGPLKLSFKLSPKEYVDAERSKPHSKNNPTIKSEHFCVSKHHP